MAYTVDNNNYYIIIHFAGFNLHIVTRFLMFFWVKARRLQTGFYRIIIIKETWQIHMLGFMFLYNN